MTRIIIVRIRIILVKTRIILVKTRIILVRIRIMVYLSGLGSWSTYQDQDILFLILLVTSIILSTQENSPPPNPLVYEDSFNRTLQSALLNLGKTG